MRPKPRLAATSRLIPEANISSSRNRLANQIKSAKITFVLWSAVVVWVTCATSSAQSILGSSGAGFQSWTAADLNNNGAPYWDAVTENYLGDPTNKNVGFCLTGTGDCVGILTSVFVPGPIPFWGMSYNSGSDLHGAIDPAVYFRRGGERLKATLQLQLSSKSTEINEFRWFETNKTGSVHGARHRLFQGSGVPPAV